MIREIKRMMNEKNYKGIFRCIKSIFPSYITENLVFFMNHGKWIDFTNPQLLDEKLLILRIRNYENDPLIIQCTDKYAVREYIRSKGFKDLLIPLIGCYNNAKLIPWDELPNEFVIKCTHGSGYNFIISDKNNAGRTNIVNTLNYWLKEDYATISAEKQYRNIPHLIVVEELIPTLNGELPIDYKFFCSRGQMICALVITGRGKHKERIFVDEQYKNLHLVEEYSGDNYLLTKPDCFEEMVLIAQELSKDFPFVRVDLYDVNGKVIFGELTFTPHGCNHDYLSYTAQMRIGEKIILS